MHGSRLAVSGQSWRVAGVTLVSLLIQSGCETGGRSPAGTRLEIDAPPTYTPTALEISPDGKQIVYVSEEQGPPLLWVYSLESEVARPLEGSENAAEPFWSPDSRFIGFFTLGLIHTVDVDSGAIDTLTTIRMGTGGSWNADGVILLTGTSDVVVSVPAAGGPLTPVLRLRPGETGHRAPYFLPDGRHFLYMVRGQGAGLYLGALEESEIAIRGVNSSRLDPEQLASFVAQLQSDWNPTATRKIERLLDSDTGGVYSPSGHLLFVRGDTLYARGFDLDQMSLTGEEFAVTDESISWASGGFVALSVSSAGDLVYRARTDGAGLRQLTWLDRGGNELERLGDPLDRVASPELSPDGDRVAFSRLTGNEGLDVYTIDNEGGDPERLTTRLGPEQA